MKRTIRGRWATVAGPFIWVLDANAALAQLRRAHPDERFRVYGGGASYYRVQRYERND